MKTQEKETGSGQRISKALQRYQKLLDHYKIGPQTREAVWPGIINDLNSSPEETAGKIKAWWEEVFAPEKSPDNSTSSPKTSHQKGLEQLPEKERIIYEARRNRNRKK